MRIEFILFIIAGAVMYNIYTDGKFLKMLFSYQKYYKMMGVALFAFMLFYLFRKNPNDARNIITTTNDYIKYLPLDRSTSSFITPILDFTAKQNFRNDGGASPILSMGSQTGGGGTNGMMANQRLQNSGKTASTKRSVSETKKNMWPLAKIGTVANVKNNFPRGLR